MELAAKRAWTVSSNRTCGEKGKSRHKGRGGIVLSGSTVCPVCLESLENRLLMAVDPIISEFMAINDNTLEDKDGDFSDWIEIHNPGTEPLNLQGWHLTDDDEILDKWTFP